MRPGYQLVEAICKALDLPTDALIGLKLDAWDPEDVIVLTTQYMVGIKDGEVEIKEQRWVPEEPADRFGDSAAMPNFDPDGTHLRAWVKAAEDQALRNMGIEP